MDMDISVYLFIIIYSLHACIYNSIRSISSVSLYIYISGLTLSPTSGCVGVASAQLAHPYQPTVMIFIIDKSNLWLPVCVARPVFLIWQQIRHACICNPEEVAYESYVGKNPYHQASLVYFP